MPSQLARYIVPFSPSESAYDALIDRIGDARFVLIGEASHGTHEFYKIRAELTQALIANAGFDAVAVEADWPDAHRVNQYVQGSFVAQSADEALSDFTRFPKWMWRNTVMLEFVDWLQPHNRAIANPAKRAGFYGLDLYSLRDSMAAVVSYLDKVDPEAAKRARYRYSCFDQAGEDPQAYGYAATYGVTKLCLDEVTKQLLELQQRRASKLPEASMRAEDELFYAEQNARLAVNAEEYYRSMFAPRESSWNLRDTHMFETLKALDTHLSRTRGVRSKIVVWAHNSHLGDARATDMGESGELNLGQLAREELGEEVFSIGFSTNSGTVTAAHNWDEPEKMKNVRQGLDGSYEKLFHETGTDFTLDLHTSIPYTALPERLLERAIGVIYRPATERLSHYFYADIRRQFDAIIYLDTTTALTPIDPPEGWDQTDQDGLPETYPSGL